MASTGGINMLDVKKSNRALILWTVYRSSGISRKEIAAQLGLTPAAITLITTDLIAEGLLSETQAASSGRKGRKEILLEINKTSYATVGIYISTKYFQISCVDLALNIIFEEKIDTRDCGRQSAPIIERIISTLSAKLSEYNITERYQLLGIGICVHGIVDSDAGVSVNSYGIWEENVAICEPVSKALGVPSILSNNICALAHGENFVSGNALSDDTLFIKYGPGVGAARLTNSSSRSIYDYSAVELGHLIVDPDGNPCVCGSRGCLETIVGYNAIEQSISPLISKHTTPLLYRLTGGAADPLDMHMVMEAYSGGEKIAAAAMKRTVLYLALSIRNSMTLFKPSRIILYGELFENMKFRDELNRELTSFAIKTSVSYSQSDPDMSALAPATTIISQFFEEGGLQAQPS